MDAHCWDLTDLISRFAPAKPQSLSGDGRHSVWSNYATSRIAAIGLLLLALLITTDRAMANASSLATVIRQPLSLDQAVHLAVERNPNIKSAQNALQAAEAARLAAVGKLYPQIKALSWYELSPTQNVLPLPGHMAIPSMSSLAAPTSQQSTAAMLNYDRNQFQTSIFNIGLGLNWPLYMGGRLEAAVSGAQANTEAARYQLLNVRQQLSYGVVQTYLGIEVDERIKRALHASIRHLSEAKANFQEFVKVGQKPRLDLLRVDTRLEQTRQLQVNLQAALVTLRGNLRRLMNLNPSGYPLAIAKWSGMPDTTPQVEPLPIPVAIEEALAHRPDYLALQAKVGVQRAQLQIAQGARLPEVNLSAQVWEAHGNNTGSGLPYASWEPDSQIMLTASIPLFTGGTLIAQVNQESALLQERRNRLARLAQRVRQDVVQSTADLHAAIVNVQVARVGMKSADEAFRVEEAKTTVGVGTVTDLLDVQAAELSAQTSFYQAQAEVQMAWARYELTLGVLGQPLRQVSQLSTATTDRSQGIL